MTMLDNPETAGGLRGTGAYTPDPVRRSKLKSAEEAFKAIKDGAIVAMTCSHYMSVPLAAMRQIIRQGTNNLTIIPTPSAGIAIDLLIAAGAVKKTYVSYVGLESYGLAPNFRRAVQDGEVEVSEADEATLIYGYRAAAAGLPYALLPGYYKLTSLPTLNPGVYREIADPFTGKPCFAVPPLKPDVAVIHVPQCDEYGNARQLGGEHTENLIAKASDHVIITTEEIIPTEMVMADPTRTTVPGFLVDSVVRLPFGCHPGACPARYSADEAHLADYARIANEGRTADYIKAYVADCADHNAYLDKIGASRLINLQLY
jgi:glutaconate CoA-transferase subunit A